MSLTFIKQNKNISKMNFFGGIKTSCFKMTVILFVVILNTKGLYAQNRISPQLLPVLKVTQGPRIVQTPFSLKNQGYTVFIAKSFPKIEAADQTLAMMEETDEADYELLGIDIPVKEENVEIGLLELAQVKKEEKNL